MSANAGYGYYDYCKNKSESFATWFRDCTGCPYPADSWMPNQNDYNKYKRYMQNTGAFSFWLMTNVRDSYTYGVTAGDEVRRFRVNDMMDARPMLKVFLNGDMEYCRPHVKCKENMISAMSKVDGVDLDVIRFISEILYHGVRNIKVEDSAESVRSLFEGGYCYYFAQILKDAFPGGELCVCYPYGHIVYAYKGVMYDISGVSDAEYEELIPVDILTAEELECFRHVSDKVYPTDIKEVYARWKATGRTVDAGNYVQLMKSAERSRVFG